MAAKVDPSTVCRTARLNTAQIDEVLSTWAVGATGSTTPVRNTHLTNMSYEQRHGGSDDRTQGRPSLNARL